MSMSSARSKRRKMMAEINVVPYIDVMLVLLIIFMTTAQLMDPSQAMPVDLPQTNVQQATDTEPDDQAPIQPVVLTVDAEGKMYLNLLDEDDVALEPETIRTRVSSWMNYSPDSPVRIRADASLSYQTVFSAMNILTSAGVTNVGLMNEVLPNNEN